VSVRIESEEFFALFLFRCISTCFFPFSRKNVPSEK
jgi:hypothetical protein